MRSFIIAAISVLVASVVAMPSPILEEREPSPTIEERTLSSCMSDSEATKVANNFKTLISDYSDAFANASLTVDFTDYSDGVTELINSGCTTGPATLGAATFSSRAAFEAGQGSQPNIPFEILNIWNNCNTVTLRWRTALTPQFVTGIIVLEVSKNADKKASQKWLIKTVYSEFNSGAWLVDLGVFTPTCSATKRSLPALL